MILSDECYIRESCKKNELGNCPKDSAEFCAKLFRLNYLYDAALLSDRQRTRTSLRVDADGTDREQFLLLKGIEEDIESFVKCGNNLYIHSRICGNGKTEWSLRLLQAYLNAIWHRSDLNCKALFISVPRFLLSLKDHISMTSSYIEHIKKHVLDADLVVWDEIAVSDLTKFEHEHLLNLVNTRIDYGKSNIFTSNQGPEELKEKLGERLYSRVVNLSTNIELFGSDKRGLK